MVGELKEGEEVLRYSVLTVISSKGKEGGEQLGGHWSVDSTESQPAQMAMKGAGHKTVRLIWWEVGRNCRGSLTELSVSMAGE